MLQTFANKPISFEYAKPATELIAELARQNKLVIMQPTANIVIDNAYYKAKHPGTHENVFAREALFIRIQKMCELLHPHYGVSVFDVFRTRVTQKFLFDSFFDFIHAKKPYLSDTELQQEIRKYVSHPDEPARFTVSPHNTGGAIDLALFDLKSGQVLDFGCPIDETENISSTDFFESEPKSETGISPQRWLEVRKNRRILFHTMIHLGFTNYHTEWWHYDLGDAMWANIHKLDPIYPSMEPEVLAAIEKIEVGFN